MPKILVIGAHPADPVDLAGGTIYHHRTYGHEVYLMTLTDGLYSHNPVGLEREDKRAEFKAAAKVLDVPSINCYFEGLEDEPLVANTLVIRELAVFIRNMTPDIVITHHPNEYAHWDHAECGKIVCRALKAAIKLPTHFGVLHFVPSLYFFAVQFRPEVSRVGAVPQAPDILVGLGNVEVGRKVQAMMCFASQGHDDEEKMWQRMNSFESEMGRADGLRWSEGFILGQPLKVSLLPQNPNIGFYNKKDGKDGL